MAMGGIDTVSEAITALAAVDPDPLTDPELDETLIRLQREAHRLAAVTARVAARWESRGVWLSDGSRSSAARLARDAGMSLGTARRDLRRARALAVMPVTAAALVEGRVSMDHVDLLAAADIPVRHEAFVRDEAMLVEQCATLRYREMTKVIAYWKLRVDATGCDADAQADAAHLHASPTLDGTVRIDGQLDAVGGTMFLTELDRLEREQDLADQAAGVTRTKSQRRAAALVQMASRSTAMPTGARRPKPLLTVLVGEERFVELCELANGIVLTPGQVLPHLGAAEMETVLFDGLTVLGVSNRRSFIGKIRRAVEVRDLHCQHPSGCDVPASDCDVDHIVPKSQGGETSQFNGRMECRPHNRDSTKHDHDAQPFPPRDITAWDIDWARRRWRRRHREPGWDVWRLEFLPIPNEPDEPHEPDDTEGPPEHSDAA